MREHRGDPGHAADVDHLVHGGDHPDAVRGLVAVVACIGAAERGHDLAEFLDLLGRGIVARHVEGPGREAPRALLHAAPHERPHAVEFGGRGGTVLAPHDLAAHRPVTDELSDVHAEAVRRQLRPLLGEIDRAAPVRIGEDRRQPHRQEGFAVAEARAREAGARVRMRVDEAGRHVQTGRIDHFVGGYVAEPSDGGDPLTADEHVRQHPRVPGAVEHASVLDEDGALLGARRRGEGQQKDGADG